MLTFEDCLAHARITEDEMNAIAEHEHIPAILAVELAGYLCRTKEGERRVGEMIVDDIAAARSRGATARAAELERLLQRWIKERDLTSCE